MKPDDSHHDDAGREEAEPFEIGMFRGNTCTRGQDFDVKTELIGFGIGHKIWAGCIDRRTSADFPDDCALAAS